MKVKQFFTASANCLNKGYAASGQLKFADYCIDINSINTDAPNFNINPEILATYEEIKPGLALKLLELAKLEQLKDQQLQEKAISLQHQARVMGQCFACCSFLALCYTIHHLLLREAQEVAILLALYTGFNIYLNFVLARLMGSKLNK